MLSTLKLCRLTKNYGATAVVRDISLNVDSGEFFVILGPSGSGKTTLLRLILGLQTPSAGDILIDDKRVEDIPPHKRMAGMVFQNLGLFPHKTVEQNIRLGFEGLDVSVEKRNKRIYSIAEKVGIPEELLSRKTQDLSGGEGQRVALARALVSSPRLLLMDEPLSNLDVPLRQKLLLEFKRIHRETGTTIVYVTHDQEEALFLADRIAIMRDGQIVQSGTPTELYQNPSDLFVANFLGTINVLSGVLEGNFYPEGTLCGIRPEDIKIVGRDTSSDFLARVLDVRFLGKFQHVTCAVDTKEVVVYVPVEQLVELNSIVGLRFNGNKSHYFDPETSKRTQTP